MGALYKTRGGFTLIEMSIVLVIIGLIVGGIMVGQSLIAAAGVRAQSTQIEKFNTAANTFYGKYGALPGDISAPLVSQLGFTAYPVRAGTAGQGDGNGELDGVSAGDVAYAWNQDGENGFFWVDLTVNTHLIQETVGSILIVGGNCSTPIACSVYFPPAKIGGGNVIYTYSGYAKGCCSTYTGFGPNFFGLSLINSLEDGNVADGAIPSAPGLTVSQAYSIDTKIDDGMPTTGNVLAQYLGPSSQCGTGGAPCWSPKAAAASSATCYDTTSNNYSMTQDGGAGVNCALSFRIKAGDQ
jgi:prepilin-type N-terminal cleavage/methylation domain-containing protein